jgi:hypothetical protein
MCNPCVRAGPIGPDGKVLYKRLGTVDILELRRAVLANLPSDYIGFNRYWQAEMKPAATASPDGK